VTALCGGVDTRPAPEAGPLLSIRRGAVCAGAALGVDRCSTGAGVGVVTRPGWTVPVRLGDSVTRDGTVASDRPVPEAGPLLSTLRGWVCAGVTFGVDRCSTGAGVVTRPAGVAPVRLGDSVTRDGGVPGRAVVGATGVGVVTRPAGVAPVRLAG
jgi:hypothetical protein